VHLRRDAERRAQRLRPRSQLGYTVVNEKRLSKPMQGQFKKAGTTGFGLLREFALADGEEIAPAVGTAITVARPCSPRTDCQPAPGDRR